MSKIKAPFLGLPGGSGKIGGLVITSHGQETHVREYNPPTGAETAAQHQQRSAYSAFAAIWSQLEQADRDYYAAKPPRISTNSGFSTFIRTMLKEFTLLPIGYTLAAVCRWTDYTILQGTWTTVGFVDCPWSGFLHNSSDNDGDGVQFNIYVPKGEWRINIIVRDGVDRGICKVYFNGEQKISHDCYAGSNVVSWQDCTKFAVPYSAIYPISCVCVGKNPSSSGYQLQLIEIAIARRE